MNTISVWLMTVAVRPLMIGVAECVAARGDVGLTSAPERRDAKFSFVVQPDDMPAVGAEFHQQITVPLNHRMHPATRERSHGSNRFEVEQAYTQ